LETTRIYSAMGRLPADEPLLTRRPCRMPHHTISDAGMVGGGSTPTPGEISLAHHGILFLDELPEFHRRSLEVLRQPLEQGQVTISRALNSTTFPARFGPGAATPPVPGRPRGHPGARSPGPAAEVGPSPGQNQRPLWDRTASLSPAPLVGEPCHAVVCPAPLTPPAEPIDPAGSLTAR